MLPNERTSFGLKDGISHPAVAGSGIPGTDPDEKPLAAGEFVLGHGMDVDVLERAGIAEADAAVVATNGDNTNVVVGQVVQRRYNTNCVVVRVLDPRRAAFYAERGLRTVCPTQTAIATLTDVVRSCEVTPV